MLRFGWLGLVDFIYWLFLLLVDLLALRCVCMLVGLCFWWKYPFCIVIVVVN